jgi:C4-type Zn-finger protein
VRNGEVFPVTLVLDDPSGNSYIKNPFAPKKDPKLKYVNLYLI